MGSFGAEAPQDDAGWRVFSAVILSETKNPIHSSEFGMTLEKLSF